MYLGREYPGEICQQNRVVGILSTQDTSSGVRLVFSGSYWLKLQSQKEGVLDIVFVDGPIVPLHRHGGGALKK
jgi:hypothetical protein